MPNDWGCDALYVMPSKWGYANLGLSCNGSRCWKEDTTSTMAGSIVTAVHSRLKWDKFLYMHGMLWEVMMQSPKVIQNGVDDFRTLHCDLLQCPTHIQELVPLQPTVVSQCCQPWCWWYPPSNTSCHLDPSSCTPICSASHTMHHSPDHLACPFLTLSPNALPPLTTHMVTSPTLIWN